MSSLLRRLRRRTTAAATVAVGVAALATGTLIAAGPAAAESSPTAVPCNVVPIFETDGFGRGHSLQSFRGPIPNQVPFNQRVPAGYAAVPVEYDDGVFPIPGQLGLDESVPRGEAALTQAVHSYHDRCPGSRIIITGFSEGAVVAGNVINTLAHSNYMNHGLVKGALYGDPRRPFGNGGRGGVAGGIETNLPTLIPGITMQGPNDFGDIAVREVCNENDGICNSTNLITNAAAFANGIAGYSPLGNAHGYYIDPVAAVNRGPGLDFYSQNPIIAYGAPLPIPNLGTPWQIQNLFGPAAGQAAFHNAIGAARSLLPQPVIDALSADPWFRLINS